MHRVALILMVAPLLLLGSGCSRPAAGYGSCLSVLDCRSGEMCSEGQCLPGPALPVGVFALELVPASNTSTSPVRTEVSDVVLGAGELAVAFPVPVVLDGRIVISDAETQPSVGAAVTLTRPSYIGLGPAIYSVTASPGKISGDVGYSLRLPATATSRDQDCYASTADCYEMRVVPTDLHLFPPVVKRIAVPSSRSYDIVLPSVALVRVTGIITDAALTGLAGLEVRIVDADGRTRSSVGTTRAGDVGQVDAGFFQLGVPDDIDPGRYWLEISASEIAPHAPTFYVAFDVGSGRFDIDLGEVTLPHFTTLPAAVGYRVLGPAANGRTEPVQGALVRFTRYLQESFAAGGTPADCTSETCGIFTRQATSNEDGEVGLELVPGTYEVEVLPGGNSPYAAMRDLVEVLQEGFGPDLRLARKLEISATVLDVTGAPVPEATISAEPWDVVLSADTGQAVNATADLALSELPSSIQTDGAGQFLLKVEPGIVYDIVVTPADEDALPITTIPSVSFESDEPLTIRVPPAALLAGSVTDWADAPAAGTLVRLYELVFDLEQTDAPPKAWLRGEAVSDAEGGFRLLLPGEPRY